MKIEVSNGELVDKAAVLKVKLDRLADPNKGAWDTNVAHGLRYLHPNPRHCTLI
jgi:hypothetical protein